MLTIALPKGRIGDQSLKIFEKVTGHDFLLDDRKLAYDTCNFRFLFVRSQDVASYVFHQAADLGIVGLDVLEEQGHDVVILQNLHIGKCNICIGVPKEKEINYLLPEIKVATKMENITRRYFSKKAVSVDIVKLYGSIEIAPVLGLSDIVVDIVETGNTMKQNGLRIAEIIGHSTAHLVCNKNSLIIKKQEILALDTSIKAIIS